MTSLSIEKILTFLKGEPYKSVIFQIEFGKHQDSLKQALCSLKYLEIKTCLNQGHLQSLDYR